MQLSHQGNIIIHHPQDCHKRGTYRCHVAVPEKIILRGSLLEDKLEDPVTNMIIPLHGSLQQTGTCLDSKSLQIHLVE